MRKIAVFAATLLATVILSVPASAANGWTAPKPVWDAKYTSPSMVADGHGAVHMAVVAKTGIWYLTNKTGHWTRVHMADRGRDPQIAIDRSDHSLTIVYEVDDGTCCPGNSELFYVTDRHPGGPGAWSAPRVIPDGGGPYTSHPSVVVRDGVIAIAANVGVYDATVVEFITNATGHWTHRDISGTGQRWAGEPSLALDRQGRPVIAYQVHGAFSQADAIRLARGATRTGSFATELVVAMRGATGPSLVLGAKGQPRFSFDAADGTYQAKRAASGWQVGRVWRDGHESQLRIGGGGHARIASLRDAPTKGVWFANWSNGKWHRERLDARSSHEIALAVAKGNRTDHIVYTVRGRVWYTHSK